MNQVQIIVTPPEQAGTYAQDIDEHLRRSHAKHGYPVEVRITRGHSTQVLNLSRAEAVALYGELQRAADALLGRGA